MADNRQFRLDPSYNDVAHRLAELREKHPDASMQPLDLSRPFYFERLGDQTFLVYIAACYRKPDDTRPGVGIAWEPFPGRTPYTRDSEVMVAETSAWGRAIVAALAADTKKGVASSDEAAARTDNHAVEKPLPSVAITQPEKPIAAMTVAELIAFARENGVTVSGSKSDMIRTLQPLVLAATGQEPFGLDAPPVTPVDPETRPFEPVVAS